MSKFEQHSEFLRAKGLTEVVDTSVNGEIYICKQLYLGSYANDIDFSKFSLEELDLVIDELHDGFDEDTETHIYPSLHPMTRAVHEVNYKEAISELFKEIAPVRRKAHRRFL